MVSGSAGPSVLLDALRRQRLDLRGLALHAARWLQAPAVDVVTFYRRAPCGALPTDARAPADLRIGLAAWQRSVARLRVRAVLRRWLLAAAMLALLLCLVDRVAMPVPVWMVIAVPSMLAAIATAIESLRIPSLDTIAQLADRRMGLKEQVASGLEMVEGRARICNTGLDWRLEARAATLVDRARHEWVARPSPVRAEWFSLIALWGGVLVLVILPRPATAAAGAPSGPESSAVAAATTAPYHLAFPLPPRSPSEERVSMQLQVAVVQTPVAAHAAGETRRTTQPPRPVIVRKSTRPGTQSLEPATGSGTTGKTTRSSGGRGGQLPSAPDAPRTRQQSGVPGSSSVSVYANRYRVAPPSGSSPTLPGRAGLSRGAPGQANARASTSTQARGGRTGVGRPASGPVKGTARPGGAPPGPQSLPYTGGARMLPSQLPKPGLITGKGSFTGRGTPGGTTPGTERSSATGRASAPNSLRDAHGRQLALQSPYGAHRAGDQTNKTVPVKGGASAGQAHVNSAGIAQGSLQTIDYVPPDGNYVAPDDRTLVTRYFVLHTVQ